MFCLATLLSSVMAIFRGGIWFGLSGLAASFMAIIAGGVTILIFRRGSNRIGEAVFILITLLGGALYWVESIGWDFQLWGIHLSGLAWCLIGFGISFLFRAVAAD